MNRSSVYFTVIEVGREYTLPVCAQTPFFVLDSVLPSTASEATNDFWSSLKVVDWKAGRPKARFSDSSEIRRWIISLVGSFKRRISDSHDRWLMNDGTTHHIELYRTQLLSSEHKSTQKMDLSRILQNFSDEILNEVFTLKEMIIWIKNTILRYCTLHCKIKCIKIIDTIGNVGLVIVGIHVALVSIN